LHLTVWPGSEDLQLVPNLSSNTTSNTRIRLHTHTRILIRTNTITITPNTNYHNFSLSLLLDLDETNKEYPLRLFRPTCQRLVLTFLRTDNTLTIVLITVSRRGVIHTPPSLC
jgi:hypothetical protein